MKKITRHSKSSTAYLTESNQTHVRFPHNFRMGQNYLKIKKDKGEEPFDVKR